MAFNGMNFKLDDLEWKLHRLGVLNSNLNRNPNADFEKDNRLDQLEKEMVKTIRQGIMRSNNNDDDDDLDY